LPGPNDRSLGGHAVMCVGFNDETRTFIMRNSWGPEWGDQGYFYIPYEYLTDPGLTSDIWALELTYEKMLNSKVFKRNNSTH